MNNAANKKETLEILLSTMNRTSLTFLEALFPEDKFLNYQILIINQTSEDQLLVSHHNNIRVINSFEKGLPQSRNLALENAKGTYCLIADDDVKYKNEFASIIFNAFEKHANADLITFQMEDEEGNLFKPYQDIEIHDKKTISTANSVVIAFKRERILESQVKFNPNFGLGTTFPTANEYVFMRNALKADLKLYFEPKVILSHPFFSSGKDFGSDIMVYSRAALFYKYSGILGYLRLGKYLYLILKRKAIQSSEIISKFRVGLKGIRAYKRLVRQGLEKR